MFTWGKDSVLNIKKFSRKFNYPIHFYSIFVNKGDFYINYTRKNQILQRTIYAGGKNVDKTVLKILRDNKVNFKKKLEDYLETNRIFERSYKSWFKNKYFPLIFLRVISYYSKNEIQALKRIFNSIDYVGSYNRGGLLYLPKSINEVLSPHFAYFCGFFFGDGNINKSGRRLTIVDGNKNAKELDRCYDFFLKLRNFLKKYIKNIEISKSKEFNKCILRINSKSFCRLISFFFEHPLGKKKKLKLPIILNLDENSKKYFIRGLFDSDGSFRNHICIGNKSQEFLKNIGHIFNKYSIHYSLYKTKKGYSLAIPIRDSLLFAQKFGVNHPNKQKDMVDLLTKGSKQTFFMGFKNSRKYSKEFEELVSKLRPWGHKVRVIKRQTDIEKIKNLIRRYFNLELRNGVIYSKKLHDLLERLCIYSPPWVISGSNIKKLKNSWVTYV